MEDKSTLSVIVVCSENDASLRTALQEYMKELATLPYPSDLTIVGNGAAPEAAAHLLEAMQDTGVPCTVVTMHHWVDESTAIRAGIQASSGQIIAILPPYLQSDPEVISRMVDRIHEGADYVASWRQPRVDSQWSALASSAFNRLARWMTGMPLHDLNSGVRVLRRELADQIPIYGDLHRFWPVLADREGYRISEVQARHLEERVRRGDYYPGVILRRLVDLLTLFFLLKFTRKPLRFFGLLGSGTLAIGLVITSVLVLQRVFGVPLADRPALIFGVLFIALGIELFSFGLLGELVVFTHGKQIRDYHVEEIYELEQKR